MKFDVAIIADGKVKAESNSVSFLVALAMFIGFARKEHKDVLFTFKTSDYETSKDENDVQP